MVKHLKHLAFVNVFVHLFVILFLIPDLSLRGQKGIT